MSRADHGPTNDEWRQPNWLIDFQFAAKEKRTAKDQQYEPNNEAGNFS